MKLAQESLARFPGVATPQYDRSRVTIGIVHFGVGGFHRAHEAMYTDRLLAQGHRDWGICGIGTQPADKRMGKLLKSQDYLYTLLLKHPDGELEPRVIGSLIDFLYAPDDPAAVIARLADPSVKIVSLTITEGGYQVDPDSRNFEPVEPQLLLDLQPGATPRSALGLITEGLAERYRRGVAPFTVMSCDNLPGNGDVARRAISGFAALRHPECSEWIRRHVAFPNSMVDRITPATTDADRELLAARFGVQDSWPVVCEPYVQWVLEDRFSAGRPPWDDVGAQLVPDVQPYELMKLRLLNGGHQAICYLGYLAGYRYTDEVCADPLFAQFLMSYFELEASPTLPAVPGVDLAEYRHTLLARFSNPYVRDSLARLCAEGSDRIPNFVLPVIRDRLRAKAGFALSALVTAAWARYCEAIDEQGQRISVVDRALETVLAAAGGKPGDDAAAFLRTGFFGDLINNPEFVTAFQLYLGKLHSHGARAAVRDLTNGMLDTSIPIS
jgi:mannitol 2-dehydrogenase